MASPDARHGRTQEATIPLVEVLDLALRHVSDGVVVLGRDWRCLYVNPRAEELLGRPAAALIGRDYREACPDAAGASFHEACHRAMERRETVVVEEQFAPWDRWFEHRIHPTSHGITILLTEITDRRRAERLLADREQRVGQILKTHAVGTWTWDFRTERVSAEPSLAALVGIEVEGPLVMSAAEWLANVHADDREEVRRRLYALRDDGATYDALFRFRHADGRDVWVHATGLPVRDAEGRLVEAIGAVRDVSADQRVATALLESEADMRLAADAAGLLVWSWDFATNVVLRRGSLLQRLGYAPTEVPGDGATHAAWWMERVHPDDRAAIDALTARAREGRLLTAESYYRFRRRDDSYAILHSSLRVHGDVGGRAVRALGVDLDVSELREKEARFRQVVETIDQVFWLTEAGTGRPVYVSPAFERIWGVPVEALYRDPAVVLTRVHPDDRDSMADFLVAITGDRPVEHTMRIVRPDGEERWLTTRGFPVRDGDGRVIRTAGVTTDVTERVLAERALRASEERLQQAQRMEAIGRLAGGVAHDFNNLLTAISISLELARDALADHEGERAAREAASELEEAARAAGRASDLTRQLLAFGGRQVLRLEPTEVNAVVRESERMLQRLMPDDVLLDLVLDDALGPVEADPGQLEQVLMNLVLNARDAMPHGGTVLVETAQVPARDVPPLGLAPGDWVRLSVRDAGHGMDEATLAHVFEPFFTTKPHGRGTGLGLATVHGIVAQSGGQVRAESAPGAGTTFHVYLPRIGEDARAGAPEVRDAGAAAAAQVARACILVVEDERAVREAARRMLARRGYCVLEARHGADGLLLWRERRGSIDAVVTDVRMPEMDGIAMAEALWRDAPDLPIVFMSGYAASSLSEGQSVPDGAIFVEKPFVGETLLEAVQRALAGREAEGGRREA